MAVTDVNATTLARLVAAARSVPRADHDLLTSRLVMAGAARDIPALCEILAPDVMVVSDGGGTAPTGAAVACGAEEAAWLVAALLGAPGLRPALAEINGRLGIVVYRGKDAVAVVAPEAGLGGIAALWVVRNPAKLRAWHSS